MPIGKTSIARAAVHVAETEQTRTKEDAAAALADQALLPAAHPAAELPMTELWAVKTAAIGFLPGAAPTAADAAPASLLDSVKKRGILAPVLLARTPDGALWLLDGYRRVDAAKKLKKSRVPAAVIEAADEKEALCRFEEIAHTRRATADVREGKFRAAAGINHDMPTYLL